MYLGLCPSVPVKKRHADPDVLILSLSHDDDHVTAGAEPFSPLFRQNSREYSGICVCVRALARARAFACQGTRSRYLGGRRNHNGNLIPTYCRHLLTLLSSYQNLLCASDETDLCLGTSHFFTVLCFSLTLIVAIYFIIYSST